MTQKQDKIDYDKINYDEMTINIETEQKTQVDEKNSKETSKSSK